MEAFLTSLGLVTLGEIGDKTQLLALMLAVRFRKPWVIILGILAATLLNHTLAGFVGGWIRSTVPPEMLGWILGVAFIAMGIWVLVPDKMEESEHIKNTGTNTSAYKIFLLTLTTFFLAEMGDKTQIATVGLAARFDDLPAVIAGTTIGMLVADVPAIWAGHYIATKLPLKLIRQIAALFFVIVGICTLFFGLPNTPKNQEHAMTYTPINQSIDTAHEKTYLT